MLYKEILIKISGEYLGGNEKVGIDYKVAQNLGLQIANIYKLGVKVSIVVGGGNFFRGRNNDDVFIDRNCLDQIGMLSTVMNGLYIQSILENLNMKVCIVSSIEMPQLAEIYVRRRTLEYINKGYIVIFVAGTGHPYFSTDTAAVLRAKEIQADIVIKATLVDGVYDKDPKKFKDAVKYEHITYDQVIEKNLQVMDITSISFAKDNSLPISVLDISQKDILLEFLNGKKHGTLISNI